MLLAGFVEAGPHVCVPVGVSCSRQLSDHSLDIGTELALYR